MLGYAFLVSGVNDIYACKCLVLILNAPDEASNRWLNM